MSIQIMSIETPKLDESQVDNFVEVILKFLQENLPKESQDSLLADLEIEICLKPKSDCKTDQPRTSKPFYIAAGNYMTIGCTLGAPRHILCPPGYKCTTK